MRGRKPDNVVLAFSGDGIGKRNPPSWFSQHAKAEWRRVLPILVDRQILTKADLGTLESYCVAIGQIRECQKIIDLEGMTVMPDNGIPRAHPAVKVQHAAMAQARLFASELGLTPVSRSRPAVVAEGQEDEWAGLID